MTEVRDRTSDDRGTEYSMMMKARETEKHDVRPYGFELVLDLHGCNPATFTRGHLDKYFSKLCELIDMKRCGTHYWDDVGVPVEERQTSPHTKGTSAVCFILTSSIVVHMLDELNAVYVNIFSCKEFDPVLAAKFSEEWFQANSSNHTFIDRV